MSYSQNIAKKILKEFNRKGWNLYSDNNQPPDEIIEKNLAGYLKTDTHYVLLPKADNPTDAKQVMESLERVAQKLDREMPHIKIGGASYALTGFTLNPDFVKLHTPQGYCCSYESFLNAIDSFVEVA